MAAKKSDASKKPAEKKVTVPRASGATLTRPAGSSDAFEAPDRLAKNLQNVLVDLIALQLVAKQAHWNIVGPNFRDLHLNLDEVVDIARAGSDEVAERMRALFSTPDGRPAVVAAQNGLPEFPQGEVLTHDAIDLMVQALQTTVATMRSVHDEVDEDDPTSADILHEYIASLEQQTWFIGAETRTPQKR